MAAPGLSAGGAAAGTRLVPLVLAVALFMEQLDSTVIATALPAIAADIGTSPVSLKLAFTTYLVALAIFIPISGWLADRLGAKRVFRLAIVVFALGSIACAFAGSLGAFVLARFLQGMGGSMMTPIARLLLVRGTPRNRLVPAMAWLTVPALIGPMAGPPLGGFLTTYLSWHWIFWLNVPIAAVGLILVGRYLPESPPRPPRPIDLPGFVLAALALAGLVFGLSVTSLPALPIEVGFATLAVGALGAAGYAAHARRAAYPLLDPAMLRYPLFRAAILGGSLFRVGIGAIPFLLPLMLQLGFGMTAFESGLVTFIAAVGALGAKFLAAPVLQAVGFRRVLAVGVLLSAALTASYGLFTPTTPAAAMMALLFLGGVLRSVTFTGVNALAFSDVEDADAGQATAINAVAQQVSLATGVAVGGAVLELAARLHGGGLAIADFHAAFVAVAAVSSLGALVFLTLPRDAGAAVSGHRQAAE